MRIDYIWNMTKSIAFNILFLGFLSFLVSCGGNSGRYFTIEDSLDHTTLLDSKIASLDSDLALGAEKQLLTDPSNANNQYIQLDSKTPFGLNLKLPHVQVDEQVVVQIKYSGPGKVVIVAQHTDASYYYRKMD